MMEKTEEGKPERTKWVITPGLVPYVEMLGSLYNTAFKGRSHGKMRPALIHGPRGVGKTLFTEILIRRFQDDNPGLKFERANIAAFSPELIASELFGHSKGAFTGAIRDYAGLIEKCDNGILVLEEIGEIPIHVQAKLLTFMENGEYRRVGENNVRTVNNLQIIGTTNKDLNDPNLRPDFVDRFIDFAIPAYHIRRGDVLYALAWLDPNLIATLTPIQVFSFLSYNWPGNFREIERAVQSMKLTSDWLSKDLPGKLEAEFYQKVFPNKILGTGFLVSSLWLRKLKENGIDTDYLKRLLNQYGLGLTFSEKAAFPNFLKRKQNECMADLEILRRLGITQMVEVAAFEKAIKGLNLYCDLFALDSGLDADLISSEKKMGKDISIKFFNLERKKHFLQVSEKVAKIKKDVENFIQKINKRKPDTTERITAFQEADLLEKYYRDLWQECGGKVTEFMQRSGLKKSAAYERVKKYDLK